MNHVALNYVFLVERDNMDETIVIQKVAEGDAVAFGRIVQSYQGMLTRFAERMLGDQAMAQDVVQEAFLRLWRLRTHLPTILCLRPYLLRVVRNLCLDYVRTAKPTEPLYAESGVTEIPGKSVEGVMQTQLLVEAIRNAAQTLPEPHRTVFLLSQYEGLSYREIAEIVGCPVNTVASRKRLAVEALRRRLRSWGEEEERL